MKKIIITIIISIIVGIFITAYGSIIFIAVLNIPSLIIKISVCILIVLIYATLLYLLYKVVKSRIKEIKGGKYDDLSKY